MTRLLTRKQIDTRKKERAEELRVASNKVSEALINGTKKINTLDASYNKKKSNLTDRYNKSAQNYTLKIKELDQEVQILERKKREALEPLKEFEQELNIRRQDLDKVKHDNDLQSERLETLDTSLVKEATLIAKEHRDISNSIIALEKRENEIIKEEDRIADLDEARKKRKAKLDEARADFSNDVTNTNVATSKEKAKMKAMQINLNQKQESIDKQNKLLNSDRAKVQAIIKELKQNGLWAR